jgi:hypothetical protein
LIELKFALQAGLLDQQWLARLFGHEGIPQNEIVLPPGVIGGEVHQGPPEGGGEAILNAALVLSDGDQLLGAGGTNRVAHGADPMGEGILSEEKIVVDAEGIAADVHAALREFDIVRERNRGRDRGHGSVPCGGEGSAIGVTFRQPRVPSLKFERIAIGTHGPEASRDAGLVDEIPCEKRNVVKAGDDGRDESLLFANGVGIEVRIFSAEHFGEEREEIELDWEIIFARGHQKRFERAQSSLVGLTVFVAELVPAGPPSGANGVEAGVMNLGEVAIPNVGIGVLEVEALYFAGHICGANYRERVAVEFEVVSIDGEAGAGT